MSNVLSIRNNNPGNIKNSGTNWDGQIQSDGKFVRFASPEMGVRAMMKTLITYQDKHNLSTVREIISRWAPYGDNDTGAYIDFVSQQMGVDPDQDLGDLKNNLDNSKKLVNAIIRFEGDSTGYFNDAIVTKGISLAGAAPVTVNNITTPPLGNPSELDTTLLTGQDSIPVDQERANIINTDTKRSELAQLRTDKGFFSASDFATLKDVVNAGEENGIFWDNELDNYENYSYHIELFLVPKEEANKFNESRDTTDFETIIRGGWPTNDVDKITIAQTATSTEFNIENLVLENLGTGDGNVAKMVGIDSHLSFDIIQIGNTDLNDTLHTFANLMGYANIGTAIYFIKISYKGYDNDNPTNSTPLPIVKVIPFLITSLNQINTTTNATGTTTSLTGTAVNYISATHVVNTTKHDLTFDIKPTLNETLNSFVTELNKISVLGTGFKESQTGYYNTYNIEFSKDFKERFAESKMNNELANKSSASTEISRRAANGFNIAQQIGQATAGISIIHLLYDICIQSTLVKNELLVESPAFSNAIRIVPRVVQKEYNMITNKSSYDVTYYVTMHREIIIQSKLDQGLKISETRKLLSEIFDKGRCRKLYNYEYTGLNDQILDLTISLDRQLIKSYDEPGDEYSWHRFLKGETDLSKLLSAEQFARYNELNGKLNKLNNTLSKQSTDLEQKRSDLLKQQNEVFERTRNLMINSEIGGTQDAAQVMDRYQNIDASDNGMAELQRLNPDLFATVQKEQIATAHQRFIGLKKATLDKIGNNIGNTKSSISKAIDELKEIEIGIGAGIAVLGTELLRERQEFNKNVRSKLLAPINGISLAEELGADVLKDSNKLSDTEFQSMMDAISLNSITFERDVLTNMRNGTIVSSFSSTDRSNISLARSKFNESLNADLSMQRLSMTIKGDPFWVEYYASETTKEEKFGNNNTIDDIRGHNGNVNGTNYMMLVVNKADGVDEFDNIKIDNLDIFLYMVKKITSTFSQGQFTQTLNCIRQPIPSNFKSTTVPRGKVEGDGSGIFSGGSDRASGFPFGPDGEFGGIVNRIGGGRGSDPSVFADPFGTGENDITGTETGRSGAMDPRIVAENGFNTMAGSLSTLATTISDTISESSMPTAAQASRLTSLLNEAQMASNYGSTSATESVENVKSLMQDTFGTPAEASILLQKLEDSGETVSPELIALLNTQVYDGETVTNPIGVDPSAVVDAMSEIENYNRLNTSSVDEISVRPSEFMTPVVDTVSINNTPPTMIELENANMMLDGSLPLLSTESYTDPTRPILDYNITQLEALDLPDDVVSGYKDAASTRNGIKVRKYIDSLPQDQAELLNSIDSPYVVKTLPYDAPTIATIAATPLKTPREAIMQARIEDAQTQMIAEAGGSYNDLSADEKRHYENLSDAYDAIDEAAQLDPIRNESKLLKINDELDKSIRIYNDRLSGGDSEWNWTQKEAEEKEQLETTVLENISNLDNAYSTPIADRVIVDNNGNVNIMKDMSVLPTKPSDGFSLPMDYLSENDEFEITDEHLAQYELAENNWNDLIKGEFVTVNVINPYDNSTFQADLYSSFENPELAERYGIDTTSVTAGETISADDPRYTQWYAKNLADIRNQIASELPLVTTVDIIKSQGEDTKKIGLDIDINDFVLVEGQGE